MINGIRRSVDKRTCTAFVPAPPEPVLCTENERCRGCPYPAHDYEVVPSAVTLVELTAKGANKGGMVQRLAQLLDVKRENVLCVGDHANDISMLTWAGEGYAPANAIPLVLNTPGVHHLPDCRDDAIAALVAELDKRF